jgi:hypothetical protein
MFQTKSPSPGHHYKNSKNKVQCSKNEAHDTGSHKLSYAMHMAITLILWYPLEINESSHYETYPFTEYDIH